MDAFTASGSRRDVVAGHASGPGGRREEAGEHADGGGLPGAVRAEVAEDLAALDLERDAVHRAELPKRREVPRLDGGWPLAFSGPRASRGLPDAGDEQVLEVRVGRLERAPSGASPRRHVAAPRASPP